MSDAAGWVSIVLLVQPLLIVYFLLYHTYTLWLIALSVRPIQRRLTDRSVEERDIPDEAELAEPLTLIVPTYNEEVTIAESVTGFVASDYPRFEIVVVNDGSTDATLQRLQQSLRLRRTALPYRAAIATAPIGAMYEATIPLPAGLMRVVVIDKQNGGKADALNAGINASTAPYFISLEAGSILETGALQELMCAIRKDPRVVAVGGQIAIANGCTVRNQRVVRAALPNRSLPRFQTIEYLRSFTAVQAGLGRIDSVLMLSGVCAAFEKEAVIRAGGYLTPFLRHRLTQEYVGYGVGTACEHMEIIVRLQRCRLDKLHDRRIDFLPIRLAWIEVPETLQALRRQRSLWYRGLCESLRYHRAMLGGTTFGRIGWLVLPACWLFEYIGPLVEVAGYVFIVLLLGLDILGGQSFLTYEYLLVFLLAAVGYGILVNLFTVLVGVWPFGSQADSQKRQLLPFSRRRDVGVLLLYAMVETLGYRQLAQCWRVGGLWGAWWGKKDWEVPAGTGLQRPEAATHG